MLFKSKNYITYRKLLDIEQSFANKRGQPVDMNDSDEYQWSQLNENAYGAFIHTALSQDTQTAFSKCLLPLVLSFCIQGVFSIELFLSLPDLYETTHHLCEIPSDMQLSAVFVFVVSESSTRPHHIQRSDRKSSRKKRFPIQNLVVCIRKIGTGRRDIPTVTPSN